MPDHAEQLMRSRYSAYALRQTDYLLQTWQREFRPAGLTFDDSVKWIGLRIVSSRESGDSGRIEFEARLLARGWVDALHEMSHFVREQGLWLYTRGEIMPASFAAFKPGRNEPCPCGSGKKFKRCCGARDR